MKCNPAFGFPIPTHTSYSICNIYGAIINHKGRFLFTGLFGPLKNVLGNKKGEDLTPGQIDPQRPHAPLKHIFGCSGQKSTHIRVTCGCAEGTKKHAREQFHPSPHSTGPFAVGTALHVRSNCGRNQTKFQVNRFRFSSKIILVFT